LKFVECRLILVILLILLSLFPLFADEDTISVVGYLKNFLSFSKTIDKKEDFYLNLIRLRLEFLLKPKELLEIFFAADNEFLANDFSHTSDFQIIRQKEQNGLNFWDADYTSYDQRLLYTRHSLYRAYLKYHQPSFKVILGKQSIDWSRTRFYSPLDLFNPQSPLEIERDEKIGIDAFNFEYFLSPISSFNLIAAPNSDLKKTDFGIRIFKKFKDYDLLLIVTEIDEDKTGGFGFDGYLYNAGLRGEFTLSRSDNERDFVRAAIGLDYSPSPKVYLLGEYFYNGGSDDNDVSRFLSSYQYSRKTISLKKHLGCLLYSYELTPLFKFDQHTIYDFEGKSIFLNPEIRYNIFTNLDLSLGSQLFFGDETSEFGNYQNTYYFQLKYFF